jgi:hypothetical protein
VMLLRCAVSEDVAVRLLSWELGMDRLIEELAVKARTSVALMGAMTYEESCIEAAALVEEGWTP